MNRPQKARTWIAAFLFGARRQLAPGAAHEEPGGGGGRSRGPERAERDHGEQAPA